MPGSCLKSSLLSNHPSNAMTFNKNAVILYHKTGPKLNHPMDYEARLTTLKHLYEVLTQKIEAENLSESAAKLHESQSHLQQIRLEIERISKMRSYKK